MVSSEFKFQQFAESARGKAYHEIIYLAEQEALQAWRKAHPSKGLPVEKRSQSLAYQQTLLELIAYLRHGIASQGRDEKIEELFRFIRSEAFTNEQIVC
jgi:hypothetical protein